MEEAIPSPLGQASRNPWNDPCIKHPKAVIDAVSQGELGRMSSKAVGWLLAVVFACPILGNPESAGAEVALPVELIWRQDLPARTEEAASAAGDEAREIVTREEAVELALQANRLVKNPARLKFIAETVTKAYAGVLDSRHVLAIREEHLNACRELERVMTERAAQAKASPADVLSAQAARAKAAEDVSKARLVVEAQTAQLNYLMGRDPEARLRVRAEPDLVPATALRAGPPTVSGQ
jgi:hypothetical protein